MQNIVTRELKIIGTYIYTYEEFRETMSILSTIKSRLDQIISGITSLDKAPEVFDKLTQRDNKLVKVMIVF
jgi:threonine dehydrogenase-like Zn-dependent dehydrogenase